MLFDMHGALHVVDGLKIDGLGIDGSNILDKLNIIRYYPNLDSGVCK